VENYNLKQKQAGHMAIINVLNKMFHVILSHSLSRIFIKFNHIYYIINIHYTYYSHTILFIEGINYYFIIFLYETTIQI